MGASGLGATTTADECQWHADTVTLSRGRRINSPMEICTTIDSRIDRLNEHLLAGADPLSVISPRYLFSLTPITVLANKLIIHLVIYYWFFLEPIEVEDTKTNRTGYIGIKNFWIMLYMYIYKVLLSGCSCRTVLPMRMLYIL